MTATREAVSRWSDVVDPQPTCRMASISTNEADGTEQFVVTGPFSATFAAARDGNGTGRVYTVTLSCSDRTGNTAVRDVIVTVPHNPVIASPTDIAVDERSRAIARISE
jgi:hypothetical protein